MSQQVKQAAVAIINEVYSDLEASMAAVGQTMDARDLAATVCDRLYDDCEEYREMLLGERRALILEVCKNYV